MSDAISPLTGPIPFGRRLRAATDTLGPLCVGVDPHAALLTAWDLGDDVRGLERFARTAIGALAGTVAIVKPQSAFFERFGSAGIAVLERTLADARDAGLLTLLDVKRGDIGSTAAAYADAYLAPGSPLAADAVTVSPYLGFGSLRPVLDLAAATGRGVFVLALTSNPEGAEVQRAVGPDGRTVAQRILAAAAAENRAEIVPDGARPLGSVGVVVGATLGPDAADPADLAALGGPLLAPGVGAQGATMADLPAVFGPALPDVLPAVSREVLRAGPSISALRSAAERLRDAFEEASSGAVGRA